MRLVLLCVLLAGCVSTAPKEYSTEYKVMKTAQASTYDICRAFVGRPDASQADRQILLDELTKRNADCPTEIRNRIAAEDALVQSLQGAGKALQDAYKPPMNCIAMPPASPGGPVLMQCR